MTQQQQYAWVNGAMGVTQMILITVQRIFTEQNQGNISCMVMVEQIVNIANGMEIILGVAVLRSYQ